MPEETKAQTAPPTSATAQSGPVVRLVPADPGETEEQKALRERQDKAAGQAEKDAQTMREKEDKLIEEFVQQIEKHFDDLGIANVDRGRVVARLGRNLGRAKTVAAAAKIRTPVVEKPAEGDRAGVQLFPTHAIVAGEQRKSGEGLPTANPVKNPGTAPEAKK